MAKQSSVYRMIACMPILFISSAALANTEAYLTDSSGQVVLNGDGECWRTSRWTPEKSGECDADAKAASVSSMVSPVTQENTPQQAEQVEPVEQQSAQTEQVEQVTQAEQVEQSTQAEQVPPPVTEAPIPAPVSSEMEQAEAPAAESINISGEALFEFDQAEVKPDERQKLSEVIDKIKGQQEVVEVVITGRADAIGPEAYNQELSKKRAENVKELLLSEGITSERVVIQALGEDQPVASNNTEDGRAQNRRVDISVQTIASNN